MADSKSRIDILTWLRRAKKAARGIVGTRQDKDALVALDHALDRACDLAHEDAPELWEIDAELAEIVALRPASCRLPREFAAVPAMAHGVGLPLVLDDKGALTLDGDPLDIEAFREALVHLGAMRLPAVLYFGPYDRAGHHLTTPEGSRIVRHQALRDLGFPLRWPATLALGRTLDAGYCPGMRAGYSACDGHREVEGHAKLTHENGMTLLGIWDRSVDTRPGSHSTYIALGRYGFESMVKICSTVYTERWRKLTDRGVQIKLVELEAL